MQADAQLLIPVVDVDIRVCRQRHCAFHALFRYHETGFEHGLVVVVLIIDRHRIVPTELQSAAVIGQSQFIMGVKGVGVDRLLIIVDGIARSKTVDIIALKKFFRRCPVSLTMLYGIGVTMIVVGQFVESNRDRTRIAPISIIVR